MSFKFVQIDHPSLIQVVDDGRRAVRSENGAPASAAIAYTDQPLEVGNELVLYVDDTASTGRDSVSLTLGLTTCCVRKILKFDCHADSLCHANGPCQGQSSTIMLKRCSYKGARICVKRIHNQRQVTVFVNNYKGALSGMNFKSIGRLFPFVVLTGDVTAVRIGTESVRQTYVSPYLVPQTESVNGASGDVGADSSSPLPATPLASGYAFLLPGRPERREPGKVRTFLRGSMHGVTNKIIFLTQELLPAVPLNLKVIEIRNHQQHPFSFIFGVTTCDRTMIGAKYLHKFVYNDPSTCSGHSKYCKVPAVAVGEDVIIERTNDPFVRFTVGTTAYQMEDEDSFFKDKKIFPFVMITGSAYAISISGKSAFSPHRDRPASFRRSIRSERRFESSFFDQENPDGYQFMVNEEDGSYLPRKIATSRTRGIRMKMTFLNKELAIGDPLFIRIVRKNVEQDISFTFGVTKCNRTARDLPFDHVFNFQKPSTCRGHEIHCEIPTQPVDAVVSFERTDDDFVKIQTPSQSFLMRDRTGIFNDCKAFPYVMVNGSAYTLEIVDQSVVPPQLSLMNGNAQPSSGNSSVIEENNYNDVTASPGRDHWDSDPEKGDDEDEESEPYKESNASAPLSKLSAKKWYSNVTVTARNSKLSRYGDANSHSTIIGDKFPAGDCISFRVSQIDTKFTGSITFGVTTTPLVMIDMEEIPARTNDNWLISTDILPIIHCADEIHIRRTDTEVRLGSSGANGDESCLFPLASGTRVCPFFRFDGAISELLMTD